MVEKFPKEGVYSYEIRNAPMTKGMDWLKKHADTVIIIAAVAGAVWKMGLVEKHLTEKINEVEFRLIEKINAVEKDLRSCIYAVEKDLAIIKAVLIVKGYIPADIAASNQAAANLGSYLLFASFPQNGQKLTTEETLISSNP